MQVNVCDPIKPQPPVRRMVGPCTDGSEVRLDMMVLVLVCWCWTETDSDGQLITV